MVIEIKALSLDLAKKMADNAEKMAVLKQVKIAIAIMDAHGNLKYYRRMDGNNFVSVRMSQLKAMTAASIPISTKALAERNKSMDNSPYASVPDIVLLEGGLPIITKDGQHIGSIGISGANPELDGICAQAALDSIADVL
jgi:glc operon protein GlcG